MKTCALEKRRRRAEKALRGTNHMTVLLRQPMDGRGTERSNPDQYSSGFGALPR